MLANLLSVDQNLRLCFSVWPLNLLVSISAPEADWPSHTHSGAVTYLLMHRIFWYRSWLRKTSFLAHSFTDTQRMTARYQREHTSEMRWSHLEQDKHMHAGVKPPLAAEHDLTLQAGGRKTIRKPFIFWLTLWCKQRTGPFNLRCQNTHNLCLKVWGCIVRQSQEEASSCPRGLPLVIHGPSNQSRLILKNAVYVWK